MPDHEKLADVLVSRTRKFLDESLAPLAARLKAIEDRPPPRAPVEIVDAFKDANGVLILTLSDGKTIKTGICDGKPGKDADEAAIYGAITDKIEEAVEAAFAKLKEIDEIVADAVITAIDGLPAPESPKGADPEEMKALVAEMVTKAVEALPPAAPGKDGVNLAGALIDRDGNLILTLSDGRTQALGPVVGDKGRDAVGFDDLSVEFDGERTLTLNFTRGEQVKRFPISLPIVLDRGVWKDGGEYAKGDGVTFGGSFWIGQVDKPDGRPGLSPEWRLAVKRGQDGRPGEIKKSEPQGPVRVGVPSKTDGKK